MQNILKMESNSLQIVLFSGGIGEGEMGASLRKEVVEVLVKTLLPVIVKQEDVAKKLILKSLKDTPAIYMS